MRLLRPCSAPLGSRSLSLREHHLPSGSRLRQSTLQGMLEGRDAKVTSPFWSHRVWQPVSSPVPAKLICSLTIDGYQCVSNPCLGSLLDLDCVLIKFECEPNMLHTAKAMAAGVYALDASSEVLPAKESRGASAVWSSCQCSLRPECRSQTHHALDQACTDLRMFMILKLP